MNFRWLIDTDIPKKSQKVSPLVCDSWLTALVRNAASERNLSASHVTKWHQE